MYERAVTDNHVLLVILSTLLKYMYSSARPRTSRAFSSFAAAAHPQMSWIPAKKVTFKKREGRRGSVIDFLLYAFLLPAADEEEEEEEEGKADAASALGNKDICQTWDRQRPPIFKEICLRAFLRQDVNGGRSHPRPYFLSDAPHLPPGQHPAAKAHAKGAGGEEEAHGGRWGASERK